MFDIFSQIYDSLTGGRGKKGLIVSILFILLGFVGLWIFESSTKTFQLQRLSKEVDTLSSASNILSSSRRSCIYLSDSFDAWSVFANHLALPAHNSKAEESRTRRCS